MKDFLSENSIPFEENVSLASKSWIRFGGIAALWISPTSTDQLEIVCRHLYAKGIVFDLLGQTSNIFFHTTYNPQVVVSTIRVNEYRIEGDVLTCDCGCSVMRLAKDMLAKGYTGFYGLVGLPGTVASAAVNNAGCFSCSVSSMLISANVLMPDGTIQLFSNEDFRFEHRSSGFKRGELKGVILTLNLRLKKSDNITEECRKSEATKVYRKRHQEGPKQNLGSIYAIKKQRRSVKNVVALVVARLSSMFHIDSPARTKKRVLLWLYGYTDLNNYISDKNLNTFVWRDEKAEKIFERYKQFMSKVYDGLEMEIEEKW